MDVKISDKKVGLIVALRIISDINRVYTSASEGIEGVDRFISHSVNGDANYYKRVRDFILKRNSHPSTRLYSLEGRVVNEILSEVFNIPHQ